jgi:hypothetical protein
MYCYGFYRLLGRQPVHCDVQEWTLTFRRLSEAFVVGMTWIDNVLVSTIFTGLDVSNSGDRPLVFETTESTTCDPSRVVHPGSSTWEEAEVQHRAVVETLQQKRFQSEVFV